MQIVKLLPECPIKANLIVKCEDDADCNPGEDSIFNIAELDNDIISIGVFEEQKHMAGSY